MQHIVKFSKQSFAAALRTARKQKSVTQSGLAKSAGVTTTTVNSWENAKKPNTPTVEQLVVICDCLEVTPTLLLSGYDPENKNSGAPVTTLDALVTRYRENTKFWGLVNILLEIEDDDVYQSIYRAIRAVINYSQNRSGK